MLWVASGASAQVITLAELERKALGDRPELQGDEAAASAADADVARARSAYYPDVTFGVHASLAPGRKLVDFDPDPDRTLLVSAVVPLDDGSAGGTILPQARYGADITLKTSLYDFGRTSGAVEASRAKRSAVNANRDVTRAEITRAVRGAYLAWLGASELVSVSERAATDAKERSGRVAALIAEGVRPQADLSPMRSDELLAELELERARGDLDRRRLDVERAIGMPLPAGAIPDRSLLDEMREPQPTDDPRLHALELERLAADKAAEAQGKARNPVLAAMASAGVEAQSTFGGGDVSVIPSAGDDGAMPITEAKSTTVFPIYNVGISLSVPLWDGGGSEAAASAARARSSGIGAQIREHEAARAHEQRQITLDLQHAAKRLQTAEALVASCTAQLAEAEARYELGGGGIETIAVARAMMRRAQTEVLLAKIARVEASLR